MGVEPQVRSEEHALARAWVDWLGSDEGIEASDPVTLRTTPRQQQFLENRLWRAFMAGAKAQEDIGK